jgi:hypothetical protein
VLPPNGSMSKPRARSPSSSRIVRRTRNSMIFQNDRGSSRDGGGGHGRPGRTCRTARSSGRRSGPASTGAAGCPPL